MHLSSLPSDVHRFSCVGWLAGELMLQILSQDHRHIIALLKRVKDPSLNAWHTLGLDRCV